MPPRTGGKTLRAIVVIARARLAMIRNSRRDKIWLGVVAAMLLVGALALYGLTHAMVRALSSPAFVADLKKAAHTGDVHAPHNAGVPTDFMPYLLALPAIALFIAMVLLILTGFSRLLTSLYLSGDMDVLLVAPIPMRSVFVAKFFDALVLPYALLFCLLGPALVGYGQGLRFGPAFGPAALLVLALLPLLPAGIGALLVLAVVRVLPARRAREIVGVLGALLGATWYVLSQLSNQVAPRMDAVRTLDTLRRLDVPLLPSAWAGRALVAAGQGDGLTLLVYGGLFAACSLGVFAGCLVLAEQVYYAGWSNLATQGGRTHRTGRTPPAAAMAGWEVAPRRGIGSGWAAHLRRVLPTQSQAILYKDLRMFPRDLGTVQRLIFPLAMAGLWIFEAVAGSAPSGGRAPGLSGFLHGLGPAGLGIVIGWVIAGQVGGTAISREGKSFWLLQVAPLSPWRLLLGKLVVTYAPFPIVGGLVAGLLSIVYRQTLLQFLGSFVLVVLIGLGISSIALGLGAAFPRLDWENPRQQISPRASFSSLILAVVYLGLAIGALRGLPALGRSAPHLAVALAVTGWLLFVALTAATVAGALSFGMAGLNRALLGEGSP